jgi:hypothetical protein
MKTKQSIESDLSNGVWNVRFIKVDGSIRTMKCTRDFDYISDKSSNWITPKGTRVPSENQIIVWDLEKDAWRSFRVGSILSMHKDKGQLDDIVLNRNTINADDVRKKLATGLYKIVYRTIAGTMYETVGTRDWALAKLPPMDASKANTRSRRIPASTVIYWDFNANGFRSFRLSALIELTKIKNIESLKMNDQIGLTESEVRDLLINNICEVKFTKRDGSDRVMKCTANFVYISQHDDSFHEYEGNVYDSIFLVWDMDKHDYRNIRYDSIQSIKVVKEL